MKKRAKIVVSDYNPLWPLEFEALKKVLLKYLDNETIEIEHVGSTSIRGMKAKPIIDLDIIINKDDFLKKEIINKLSKLGYRHVGNLGITGRDAFKRLNSKTPNDGSDKDWIKHNLYLCEKGSIGLLNHINFRNYIREKPSLIIEYGQLKQSLAEKHPYDINSYIDGKTNFILEILGKAGMKQGDMKTINDENKLK